LLAWLVLGVLWWRGLIGNRRDSGAGSVPDADVPP
jgi:hypothetical protein